MKRIENRDFKILVVDDEVEYQNVLSIVFENCGYIVRTASDGSKGLRILSEEMINLVITDLKMPGLGGQELVRIVKEKYPDIEIMIATAYGTIDSAVETVKNGAVGYFVKSDDLTKLVTDVDRLAKEYRKQQKTKKLVRQENFPEAFLDTSNKEFAAVLKTCEKAARSNIDVLLIGESGVGKEVIAHYIHENGGRKNRPFIPVNCQAFSSGTIESELFGHEKGAFTGALSQRIGRFEEADGGTLFLDEVGDLPMETQGKLLRTLENRTIERIGSNKTISLDIRLISATNKELSEQTKVGMFREDLLYRINALTITIPPLRERREDIPCLIDFFLKKIQTEQKKKVISVDEEVMTELLAYNYPGNVRELKNILERLVVLSEDGIIRHSDVLPDKQIAERICSGAENIQSLHDARDFFESRFISKKLREYDGNVTRTAKELSITPRQLWNKINKYGLKP